MPENNHLIKAENLASGDVVKFPRLGWRQIERITASNSFSISFRFADGKVRRFERRQLVEVCATGLLPVPGDGEILRRAKASGRVSVASVYSLFDFKDIAECFRALRARVGCSTEAAAYAALERGATLYTLDAVYWMPTAITPVASSSTGAEEAERA